MLITSLQNLISANAQELPDEPAFTYEDGACTFREFFELVSLRASSLKGDDIGRLAMLVDRSFECVLDLFAALFAGVDLVLLDDASDSAELKRLLSLSGADALWADDARYDELEPCLSDRAVRGQGLLLFTSGADLLSLSDVELQSPELGAGSPLVGFFQDLVSTLSAGRCVHLEGTAE